MADFTDFDNFEMDGTLLAVTYIFSGENRAIVYTPASATFISPTLTGGDTFNLEQALIGVEASIQPEIVNEGVPNIVEEVVHRACIIDLYWEDEAFMSIDRATVYPGNPPRWKFGSFAESVNGVMTRYDHLTYRRQSIGRRLVLLDRDLTEPVWGIHEDFFDAGIARYRHDEYLWGLQHCHRLHLHLEPGLTFDENEGSDPPLPPNIVPLEFRVIGRVYFDFSMVHTYDNPEGNRRVASNGTYLPRRAGPHGVGWQGASGGFPI
jgi:hypothetical protein